MPQMVSQDIRELIADHQAPCISLYMPTTRGGPTVREHSIRFRSLLDQARQQLRKTFKEPEIAALMTKFEPLEHDGDFWNGQLEGLAVFASQDYFRVIRLPREVPEHVEVADSFHIKHLVRAMQWTGMYQVLCLSQRNVSLYEGNRDGLRPVELRNVPRTLTEALGEELTEKNVRNAAYRSHPTSTGNRGGDGSGGVGSPHSGGYIGTQSEGGSKKDEDKKDWERFFRLVDKALWENHSRQSGLPLMLCALEQYHHMFQGVSHNQLLMKEGIKANPDSISPERLREESWQIIEPYYKDQLSKVIDEFHAGKARELGSDNVKQVARDAVMGRVAVLLLDEDKHVGGKLDESDGSVNFESLTSPGVDDLLDDIGERVLKSGGQVIVLPHDQMPTDSGVAAIYRY